MGLANFLFDTPIRSMPGKFSLWLEYRFQNSKNKDNDEVGTLEMCNRQVIFKRVFEILKSIKPEGPYTIIETGCFRGSFLGGEGSTYFLGKWLSENGGGKLHTVDINGEALQKAQEICQGYNRYIEYHNMHSEDFLRSFSDCIDVAYLDSVGWNNERGDEFFSQYQHWKDWVLIRNKLNGVLAIDDTDGLKYGKGALIMAYLEGKGIPYETIYCVESGKWPCGVVAKWPV